MMTELEILLMNKIHASGGSIPFSDYMNDVLYTPEKGYYMAHPHIFGATQHTGDFTTAPEISPLFGKTLAQVCHKILKEIPDAIILELGAGSGKLAVDLLQTLETLGTPPQNYWILDPSPMLRKKQKETWMTHLPHWESKVHWIKSLDQIPQKLFQGIIIANEVLDAMPVQRFKITPDICFENYVICNKENTQKIIFHDQYQPTHDPNILQIAEYIRKNISTEQLEKNSYHSERLPTLKPFFQDLFASLEQGVVFLIDYGFPQHEFYHPDRYMGTLMCHYQQQTHPDPYIHIGRQDITAHVNFTDVAEKATEAGFSLSGYTQQAAFLMNAGLLHLIKNHADIHEKKAIHLLTSPSEMGELFKVIALTKNLDIYPFPGFEHFDKRHTL